LLPDAREIFKLHQIRQRQLQPFIPALKDRALAEIERLLHVPWGMNIYVARASFRPLHDEPRFEELVPDPKNNEPLL
jgi:hypothetical protein